MWEEGRGREDKGSAPPSPRHPPTAHSPQLEPRLRGHAHHLKHGVSDMHTHRIWPRRRRRGTPCRRLRPCPSSAGLRASGPSFASEWSTSGGRGGIRRGHARTPLHQPHHRSAHTPRPISPLSPPPSPSPAPSDCSIWHRRALSKPPLERPPRDEQAALCLRHAHVVPSFRQLPADRGAGGGVRCISTAHRAPHSVRGLYLRSTHSMLSRSKACKSDQKPVMRGVNCGHHIVGARAVSTECA
eukprot:3935368-Rhodomonas_salina.1